MKTSNWKLLYLALVFLSTTAFASEFVVDPGGSGDALTIQGGLDLAESGDQVTVVAGTYVENLTMVSGVVLMSATGSASTIIDGNGDMCINCEQCGPGTRISGFTLTNGGGYIGGGVRIYGYSTVEVDHNIIVENHTSFEGAGVSVQMFSSSNIHDNDFLDNLSFKTTAITVIEDAEATIKDNFFKGNVSTIYAAVIGVNRSSVVVEGNRIVENQSGEGAGTIDIYSGTGELRNNTFIRNLAPAGGSCLNAIGNTQVLVHNNLFAHNGGGGPAVYSPNCQDFSCNIFWDNQKDYEGFCNPIGADNNTHINALVCNPHQDNCSVSEFSPCLTGPCGLIGANSTPGCSDDVVVVENQSWGSLKSLYR